MILYTVKQTKPVLRDMLIVIILLEAKKDELLWIGATSLQKGNRSDKDVVLQTSTKNTMD